MRERSIRLYFDISILAKGLISLLEVIAGVLIFFIPVSSVTDLVIRIAEGDMAEISGDAVSDYIVHTAQQLSVTSGTFIAFYLLSRGLIKLVLVVALLKNQLWAYPVSLGVLFLFVIYQVYQFGLDHSVLLMLLTAFDLVVMYFIWREYQVLKRHLERTA